MGLPRPKQYLPLLGSTMLEWSLAPLLRAEWIDGVVVVLARGDTAFARLPIARHPRVQVTQGGASRADSVLAGLQVVAERTAMFTNVQVLVHDAARPCLHVQDLERLREEADDRHGALLAVPPVDTIKQAGAGRASGTVDRSQFWRAQTPQVFPLLRLMHALRDGLEAKAALTDEASAMERAGFRPRLVRGRESNLKVTYPEDLRLAAFWLGDQAGH